MLETSERLLRLLSLLPTRPAWTGAELAQRLQVTTRTMRRDVDRLRRLGYPVDSLTGAGGGYRLGAGAALPPLLLAASPRYDSARRYARKGTLYCPKACPIGN